MASFTSIFEDPKGAELETTAGEARAGAPTARIARQVEENANLEHQAAEQAASVAKTKGRRLTGEMSTSVDKLRNVPEQTVQEPLKKAVEEGKRDVADIQAAGAEKLRQVREMAAKVTSSAQEVLSPQNKGQASESSGGIMPSLQGAAETLIGTTTSTLVSARATATSTFGTVTSAAQGVSGTAGIQGAQIKDMPASSTGIPAATAPLKPAGKKLDTMHPTQIESRNTIN